MKQFRKSKSMILLQSRTINDDRANRITYRVKARNVGNVDRNSLIKWQEETALNQIQGQLI